MLDLYSVLVPVYAIIALINLCYLKLAVRDSALAQEIAQRSFTCEQDPASNQEQSALKTSIRFLIRNFTLMEFCAVGRGKYKLSLLLSVSLISTATFYNHSAIYFCFMGSLVYFFYLLMAMKMVGVAESEEESQVHREKYLQVLYSVVSIGLNFMLIVLLFKNYRNSQLKAFITTCGINLAIDNFAARPVAAIIFGAILSRSQYYTQFIEQEERTANMIDLYEKMKGKETLTKPIGKMYSPSKLPKCVPVNLEIEPVPIEREESKASKKDPSEILSKQLNPLRLPHVQNLEKSLELLRKLKKEKTAPPMLATPFRNNRFEDSQNSLLNSTNKDPSSPTEAKHFEHYDGPERYSQRVSDNADNLHLSEHVFDLSNHKLKQTDNAIKLSETMKSDEYSLKKSDEYSLKKSYHTIKLSDHSLKKSDHTIKLSEHALGLTEEIIVESEELPPDYKQRKFGSENVIMINPSRQEPIENQEDLPTNQQIVRRKTTEGSIEEEHFDFSKKPTINLEDQINNPLKISLNNSSGPSSRNEPLRICLNGEEHHFTNEDNEDQIESDRFRRRRDTLNPDDCTPAKNTLGVLQIKEQQPHCEQIEELDLNSPERRRQATKKEEEASRLQVKKKKKKLSHDDRNRVIRFTTGEPYLEYLPNMLNKQASKKKVQPRKEIVIDSRAGKRQKRRDFNLENNENIVPSFRVDDYY